MVQYGKFALDDLFSITGTKSTDAGKVSFVKNGDAQFVGRTSAGYGVQGMVNSVDMDFDPNEANTISVSQVGTIVAQYRDFPYYTSQNITKFSADFLNPEVGLYFCGIINDWLGKAGFVGYHTVKQSDLKKQVVLLPVTPAGDPDFEYMTMRIRELEAERIRELEAYLRVTGLDDTTLSTSEAQALTQKVQWKKFRIGDVFEKPGKGDVDLQNDDVDGIGEYFINSGETNLGIKGRTSREARVFPKNTITIDFFGNVYYRDFSYKLATHNHVFSFQSDLIKSQEIGLYLVGALGYLKKKFSYHNMLTWNKLKKLDIQLPVTSTGDIDFNYMQNYIRAIEKQTIKGVVEYKDRVIAETKKVVGAE